MTPASLVAWGLLAPLASPSPQPADVVRTPPPDLVTPGTLGFLVTFGVAVALVLLVRDMVRRNRGLVVRAERRDAERRDAERREAGLHHDGPGDGGAGDGPGDGRPGEDPSRGAPGGPRRG